MTERYEVVIVGGGIHGAGAAQAAAARGHSVLALEQTALAAGTSGRSSKLIHGGLRYLEHAEFGLVRECLYERALLLRLAPELVQLKPFIIPVYATTSRRPLTLRLGLSLYALLGGLRDGTRFCTIPRREWETLDGLDTAGLQAVFEYRDAQTDDAQLTRAVMRSALALGAELKMPAQFLRAELTEQGCTVHYQHNGREHICRASVLINAAGPWANRILENVTPAVAQQPVELVQGSHIEIAGRFARGIYYLEAPRDQRAVFVMPWHGHTLVGTTEKPFSGDPVGAAPAANEQTYLREVLAHYFPGREIEIINAFAGLRVLPGGSGRAFERSREVRLITDRGHKPRLLSIFGGKLTSYRATADKVLRRIAASLPARRGRADTRKLKLAPDE